MQCFPLSFLFFLQPKFIVLLNFRGKLVLNCKCSETTMTGNLNIMDCPPFNVCLCLESVQCRKITNGLPSIQTNTVHIAYYRKNKFRVGLLPQRENTSTITY